MNGKGLFMLNIFKNILFKREYLYPHYPTSLLVLSSIRYDMVLVLRGFDLLSLFSLGLASIEFEKFHLAWVKTELKF